MSSAEENEQQQITIIGKIILPILFLTVLGAYFVKNSNNYVNRKYDEFQNYSFSGEIYKKEQDQKGVGCNITRYLHLKTGIKHRVNCFIYSDMEIGDFIYKNTKSDTVYYVKKNGDTIKQNENPYYKKHIKIINND